MSTLQLSLKKKWFDMTDSGIKTEDYREINDYWCRRLLYVKNEIEWASWQEMIEDLTNPNRKHKDVNDCMRFFEVKFKEFSTNTMTLGYPKRTD